MQDTSGNSIQTSRNLYNFSANHTLHQSYKLAADDVTTYDNELQTTTNADNSTSYSYFVFNDSNDNVNSLTIQRYQINSTSKVYDLYAYVKDENDSIIYQVTKIPEVELSYKKVGSSSDGYISNASLYLNSYSNNSIVRYSDTLFCSTNDVGELGAINYYNGCLLYTSDAADE